jgi:hypothetical protein
MTLFKRQEQQADVQPKAAASASAPGAATQVLAPQTPAAPGVVPPPAAPVYSTRPPEATQRFELDTGSLVAEVTKASESPQNVQKSVRVAVQRTRTASAPGKSVVRRPAQQAVPAPAWATPQRARQAFDPSRCAQAGLLNLAWSWQQSGAPIRAIHAYMKVITRYPGTAGAAAAVADLVELSDKLADQGQFHIALGIYEELEHLL